MLCARETTAARTVRGIGFRRGRSRPLGQYRSGCFGQGCRWCDGSIEEIGRDIWQDRAMPKETRADGVEARGRGRGPQPFGRVGRMAGTRWAERWRPGAEVGDGTLGTRRLARKRTTAGPQKVRNKSMQTPRPRSQDAWIPAFAGMTKVGGTPANEPGEAATGRCGRDARVRRTRCSQGSPFPGERHLGVWCAASAARGRTA